MKKLCPRETEELLLQIFAQTNPIYIINRLQSDPHYFQFLKEYLFPTSKAQTRKLFTYSEKVNSICEKAGIHHKINQEAVLHVFPIVQQILNKGFMVPIRIIPSNDWNVSDAFGTFGELSDKNTHEIFESFLEFIEKKWLSINPEKTLPLRWRKAYSISLEGSLHYNSIGGKSLQVPLVVSVLRSFVGEISTPSNKKLPFGNNPVFSSGELNLSSGQFETVDGLIIKLKAFIREYGEGLPAILTTSQFYELKNNSPDLTKQVHVILADNLTELMTLNELHEGLIKLSSPPQPTEIDILLEMMFKIKKSLRFNDLKHIIKWLRPNISSPVYAFQLERNLGQIESHRGRFHLAYPLLKKASEILVKNSKYFGISERIDLATAFGTLAIDACNVELVKPFMKDIETHINHATSSDRAKYWGTMCQLFRMTKEYDLAISAGEKSVFFADMALASESGRDRNYLIHALLTRAKNNPDTKQIDLERANILLDESCNQWAPTKEKNIHYGFCLHFQAEIARLRNQPFDPPGKSLWTGDWGHPWMFVLLSCARNTKNSWENRQLYGREMVDYSQKKVSDSKISLFNLFFYILKMYVRSINGESVDKQVNQIENWCNNLNELGFPGWKNSLGPFLKEIKIKSDSMESVDFMCDQFFYF